MFATVLGEEGFDLRNEFSWNHHRSLSFVQEGGFVFGNGSTNDIGNVGGGHGSTPPDLVRTRPFRREAAVLCRHQVVGTGRGMEFDRGAGLSPGFGLACPGFHRPAGDDQLQHVMLVGLLDRPFTDIFTTLQDHDAVADLENILKPVRNDDLGDAMFLQLQHGFDQTSSGRHRKIGRRFVQDDDPRIE